MSEAKYVGSPDDRISTLSFSSPERRGAQPARALVLVHVLAELLEHAVDRAVVVHGALREEAVEVDAKPVERALDPLHHVLDAEHGELLRRRAPRRRSISAASSRDVLALVAALGRLLAAGAGADRLAEQPHLRAVVVDVVLALDLVAGELEQARERVADRGAARRRDRHRPGRVRADELDEHPLAAAAAAEVVALGDRVGDGAVEPALAHEQVEEARARDVDPLDVVAQPFLQLLGERRRDLARRLSLGRRAQHRGVRGVVAELGLRRALEARASRRWRRAGRRVGPPPY